MDTISRENNPSILPIAGVIVGALALVLSVVALVKTSPIKQIKDDLVTTSGKVDGAVSDARSALEKADSAKNSLGVFHKQVQAGFDQITGELGNLKTEVAKLATAKPAAAVKGAKGQAADGSAPAATGPGGDYTVKAGDGMAKIAKAHGISLAALEEANPGVDSKRLKVGQKLNLPKGR